MKDKSNTYEPAQAIDISMARTSTDDLHASTSKPTSAYTGEQASERLSAYTDASTRKPKRVGTHIPALTPKQKQFVTGVLEGKSKTEAYIQAYEHKGTRKTAYEESSRTARVPQVKLELAKHSGVAENTLITVMRYSAEHGTSGTTAGAAYASVAVSAAKDVLDRVHGKATQRVETTSQAVVINIDLTGVVDPSAEAQAQEK